MLPSAPRIRHVVGVMTGTSIDGIDAALIRVNGVGLGMSATLIAHTSHSLGELAAPLRAAAEQKPMNAGEFIRLAWEFGTLHAQVIEELLATEHKLLTNAEKLNREQHPVKPHASTILAASGQSLCSHALPSPPVPTKSVLDLICVHGQTVFHLPPYSWQLINTAPIAARFGCPIVSDLRQADLARGGQGAPITPIADWILFRHPQRCRAIVNLGGFCNVTILPASDVAHQHSSQAPHNSAGFSSPNLPLADIRGFDVCACNQLLDAVAREALERPFDEGGCIAMTGLPDAAATDELQALVRQQAAQRRSLGTGDEVHDWITRHHPRLAPSALAASAATGLARHIAQVLKSNDVDEAILAGGGAKHQPLTASIARSLERPVHLSTTLGIPIEAREAACFAILGALCADGVPITLPQVTGCREPAPIAGVWVLPSPARQ